MEQKEELNAIFTRYLNGRYTQQDLDFLLSYFGSSNSEKELRIIVEQAMQTDVDFGSIEPQINTVSKNAFENIQKHIEPVKVTYWKFIFAAAAILVAVLFAYLYIDRSVDVNSNKIMSNHGDIDPGTNRAILQTAAGVQYQLDSKGGIAVNGDRVQYSDGAEVLLVDGVQELSLRTPRGGTYFLKLGDGSKAWLNADSEIQYPSEFDTQERRVKIKGEVYFEVEENLKKPFIVESEGQVIQVLGTSFNVNCYPEDKVIYTTLLDGSIKLFANAANKSILLKPNEQAKVSTDHFSIVTVDAQESIAWKEGVFRFNATTLFDALKQVQRWYDLDLDLNQIPKNIKVHAVIDRNKKLSSVLYAIEQVANVKFKLSERRLEIVK